jgi:hypothetical protein
VWGRGNKLCAFEGWPRPQPPEPPKKEAVEAVIAAARAAAVAAALQKAEEEARELAKAEAEASKIEKKRARKEKEKKKPSLSKEEKEVLKEKKLKKMVGAIVVKTMSGYQKYMDHDQFKKYAKEVRTVSSRIPLYPLIDLYLADGGRHREGEKVIKLQRREIGRLLG